MPHCYQVNYFNNILAAAGEAPDTALIPTTDAPEHSRGFYRLPPVAAVPGARQRVVFANFNKVDKHEPASFRLFMQILLNVRCHCHHASTRQRRQLTPHALCVVGHRFPAACCGWSRRRAMWACS